LKQWGLGFPPSHTLASNQRGKEELARVVAGGGSSSGGGLGWL